MSTEESQVVANFSLVRGGLFYQLMQRMRLVEPETEKYTREIWFLGLLAWLPLLILSAFDGVVIGGKVRIPLLYDYAAVVRFLFAVPLLVAVEPVVDRWVRDCVRHFQHQGIIPQTEMPAFDTAVRQAGKMRDWKWVELILAAAAYTGAFFGITGWLASPFPTWHTFVSPDGRWPSLAGWWYALFSIPLWQFLMYRWMWRLLIWYTLLWRISRLDLQLISTHPDLACGLDFLKYAQIAFSLIAFAISSVVVAVIGNRIAYLAQPVSAVYLPMTGIAVGSLLLLLGPLFMFLPKLIMTKRDGAYSYSVLAQDYTQRFQAKWIEHEVSRDEELLGASDIQSLADLANSFDIIRNTRPVPFDLTTVVSIIVVVLVPLIPLVLSSLPLEEIIDSVLRVLV